MYSFFKKSYAGACICTNWTGQQNQFMTDFHTNETLLVPLKNHLWLLILVGIDTYAH